MNTAARNIAFIGLPGCGKTTLSRRVAKALDRPWFDCDHEIEAAEGMLVPEIFARHGEEYFRAAETRCLTRLCAMRGTVLATGGGAVLQNGPLLHANAFVVYLKRDVNDILSTLRPGTRPLLQDPTRLHALYAERKALYGQYSHLTIENTGHMGAVVQTILEALTSCGF